MFVSHFGQASILHADLDSFYASVEQRDDPTLRGLPVIVGGGVVLAASYEAKAYGVRTAMGGGQARRLCPQVIVVPPRMRAYTEASRAVFEVFRDTTPLVEPVSVDEAFLDVGGLAGCRVLRYRSVPGCANGSGWTSGCPSPSESPAPSSWPRWPARRPSPTDCCWCRPTASWRSCIRCRCAGSGASGPRPRRSCGCTASTRWPTWPSSARRRWVPWSARAWAGSSSRWRTISTAAGW